MAGLVMWTNPDADPRGAWSTVSLVARGGHATSAQFSADATPAGATVEPPAGSCWRVTRERFDALRTEGRVWFAATGANAPRSEVLEHEASGLVPGSWWPCAEVGHTAEAKAGTAAESVSSCMRVPWKDTPFRALPAPAPGWFDWPRRGNARW